MDSMFVWNLLQTIIFLGGFLAIFWKIARVVFQVELHEKTLSHFGNTSFAVTELTKNVSGLETKIRVMSEKHESRMTEIEAKNSTIEITMARIETKLDDVLKRLDRSEK